MTDVTRDDLRAAVSSGVMTEAQAASLIVLSEERSGARARRSGLDEPFELFKGFNEIFIVVGLVILFAGWMGTTGLSLLSIDSGYILGLVFSALAMGVIALLARYFTVARRMVAPSIALAVMFGISAGQAGLSLAAALDTELQSTITLASGTAAVMLSVYYALFRVPFTVALIALGVFGTCFGLLTLGGSVPSAPEDLFLLSADGPFALLTVVLGLVGLVIALRFDMSDPHRVTRRAASGFWLHVVAAPAIVNTVALTLFDNGSLMARLVLVGFVAMMALFAVVIDRRSFLVSGVGYVVALSITVVEDNAFFVILLLGAGLVLLGAQWEVLRAALMRTLPAFPGKTRLPPWSIQPPQEQRS
ncbi:Branched-chain amino acid ABC-type transport system, permease component [Roseibacterium elongatum DSM 19469]|uniref:Branched-chain amino acid ABC-type transport system, permease component n=1 Tax=Roseicyclus elongatus DSM 19469 TaxID=1294273 RepID=W8RQY6_9RHOB|nr:hypothetical protein [Roseibacterium elongatum]AHM03468.1 Branched-chain amino acid ABC-type transport system, permease component [Roseibacterium elongatum DSM 19469]